MGTGSGKRFMIGLFTLVIMSLSISLAFSAPSISITDPNGGETWGLGSTQTIRWSYSGAPGPTVRIELLRGWGVSRLISASAPIGGGGTGSFTFTVPSWQTLAANYRIRITSTSNSADTDLSDQYFTIAANNTPTAVKVRSPNGGEIWKVGTTQTIRWDYTGNPGAAVKIELLRGGALARQISGSTPIGSGGTGSFTWTVPSSQALATDYMIKVTSTSNGACADLSDHTFGLTQADPQPGIQVISPNGGETWMPGSAQMIRWNYSGDPGPAVKVILLQGGVAKATLAPEAPIGSKGSGSYSWTIPSSLAPGPDYRIRVQSSAQNTWADKSDRDFSISSGTVSQQVILHFGDIGETDPRMFFNHLADRYFDHVARGHRPLIIGSGDYCGVCNLETLGNFRTAVDEFVQLTGCQEDEIFLALGNHDDTARLNTWIWNQAWNQTRPPEGVTRVGDLILSWMHSEHPDLDFLAEEIGRKKEQCPSCIGILVGHKPLILERELLAQYARFLLLEGWRVRTLALMQDLSIQFYLAGHLELHSVLVQEGVIHNRVTPARRGFEEILITYDPVSGTIFNADITTH